MFRNLCLAGAMALGLMAFAAPSAAAPALTGACVWNSLPKPRQEVLLSVYKRDGMGGLETSLKESDFANMGGDCGVTDGNAVQAGSLLIGGLMENGSSQWLKERLAVPAAAMPAAWDALDRPTRQKLIDLARMILAGEAGDPEREYMRGVAYPIMDGLGIDRTDDAALIQISAYLLARGLRAGVEGL